MLINSQRHKYIVFITLNLTYLIMVQHLSANLNWYLNLPILSRGFPKTQRLRKSIRGSCKWLSYAWMEPMTSRAQWVWRGNLVGYRAVSICNKVRIRAIAHKTKIKMNFPFGRFRPFFINTSKYCHTNANWKPLYIKLSMHYGYGQSARKAKRASIGISIGFVCPVTVHGTMCETVFCSQLNNSE